MRKNFASMSSSDSENVDDIPVSPDHPSSLIQRSFYQKRKVTPVKFVSEEEEGFSDISVHSDADDPDFVLSKDETSFSSLASPLPSVEKKPKGKRRLFVRKSDQEKSVRGGQDGVGDAASVGDGEGDGIAIAGGSRDIGVAVASCSNVISDGKRKLYQS